jgi:hypothetical protein
MEATMRKRKPAIKRARRSTFENSFDYATVKLEKCLSRRAALEAELEDLRKEIPYLQTVIRALTPKDPDNFTVISKPPMLVRRVATPASLPPDIKAFTAPISDNIDEMPDEADKFLDASKLPPGEDLLS